MKENCKLKELEDVKYRKDYLSVDKQTAISAHGEFFEVGDVVKHESQGEEKATIESFYLDEVEMDVIAKTTLGTARICFIYKD